jgi:hypothetical protein
MKEYAFAHPYLTFWLVLFAIFGVVEVVSRFMRMFSIRKHGYPPPHCDADGDLVACGEAEEDRSH